MEGFFLDQFSLTLCVHVLPLECAFASQILAFLMFGWYVLLKLYSFRC